MLIDEIRSLLERCSLRSVPGLVLVGLRGTAFRNGTLTHLAEQVDRFDDMLFLLDFSTGLLRGYPATCGQPGWHWIKHRSYAGRTSGAPFTRPGQYDYVRGEHKGHPALRQRQTESGRLAVIRDVDQDGVLEASDRFDYPLATGINVHSSGGVFGRVGAASSGCHVIEGGWNGSRWREVMRLVYGVYAKQAVFPYAVLPGGWLRDSRRRLLMGSRGERVRALQRELGVAPDGVFGRTTDEAVRRHQRQHGHAETGVVEEGDPLWPGASEAAQALYRQTLHQPLGALYEGLPKVLDHEALQRAMRALNTLNAELRAAGVK